MTDLVTRSALKAIFETGDSLNQTAFQNLIDSLAINSEVSSKLTDGKELVTYNDTSPAGLVHNTIIDSGQNLYVDGPGQSITTSNGTYITSASNSYLVVDTGAVVTKVVQNYSGGASSDRAVTAFAQDRNFTNMIHCEFVSGGAFLVTLWVQGTGTGLSVAADVQLSTMPVMNNNTVYELTAIIDGDYVCGYCDGRLIGVAYDPRISDLSALSNQYYIQITRSTARIYDWQSYKDRAGSAVTGSINAGAVKTGMLHIGASAEASYTPDRPIYAYMGANGASATALFEADNGLDIRAKNGAGGSGASFSCENQFGYVFQFVATTSVTAEIKYRGVSVIYCDDSVAVQIRSNTGQTVTVAPGSSNAIQCDASATATHTRLLVWDVDTGALRRVTVGAANSGGTGFKVLRIPN